MLGPLMLGALLLVAGCAAQRDVAIDCPEIRIPADTERLTRFRDGAGRDITDVRLQAEVTYLSGSCSVEDEEITLNFPILVAGQRGPANEEGASDVRLFVAVTNRDREVLSRRELPLRLTFPGNKVRVNAREEISIEIPKTEDQRPRNFLIFLGFALAPAELDYNRTEGRF
ncbi:MAG: hypothetical protein RIB45_04305 [Marivibrio sp.]|uniref:hypothetical protein n=1 Tax=Marivibrio sp. TaxID=2039719 RepID=UPI0032F04BD3